jgi:caa(3)-type oxidase subunit IV
MSDAQPHSTVKTYLLVFAGLAALTGVTVTLSYLGLPHRLALTLAALIALAKCTLIASFFMHLRFERKAIHALLFTALALVALLVLAVLPDIGLAS